MISVAIPTLDGAAALDRTLAAVTVQGPDEIVVLDSESGDDTRAVAARHGATVHTIRRAEFTHGGARNRLMELTGGERVAFLTQDAEPLPGWLDALQAGFAGGVGMVCGPYVPRPDASPVARRELADWFATMRPGAYTAADLSDPPMPGPATFASSANLCLARDAWRAVPFRPVPYAEDQRLVLDLLRAGWAKVYAPAAAVLHSHAYGARDQVRRWFDEFRALHEVYGWTAPAHPRVVAGTARRRAHGPGELVYHLGREVTAAVATRADRLPSGVRRRLSLEGRA